MDISRQVFRRSSRMGLLYVIISLVMGIGLTLAFDAAGNVGTVAQNGTTVDVGTLLGSFLIPFGAIVGLIITTPVFFLFVYDKNAGVLEYLLAVGMSQRDIFKGYLKAALMLSLVAMAPVVLLNLVLSPSGLAFAALAGGIALVTGIADVAFVTVLMTAFSSMQRKPSGMNSPLGISIGAFLLIPELLLGALLGGVVLWLDVAIAVVILVAAVTLLLSLDRLIMREKRLP